MVNALDLSVYMTHSTVCQGECTPFYQFTRHIPWCAWVNAPDLSVYKTHSMVYQDEICFGEYKMFKGAAQFNCNTLKQPYP